MATRVNSYTYEQPRPETLRDMLKRRLNTCDLGLADMYNHAFAERGPGPLKQHQLERLQGHFDLTGGR
jgi:hypothetical protein